MAHDRDARDAVEKSGNDEARGTSSPPGGPHAKKELTDDSKTPASGALSSRDEKSVEPGAG